LFIHFFPALAHNSQQKEWGVFAIFALASILVPFTYWGYAKVAVKKDRKKK